MNITSVIFLVATVLLGGLSIYLKSRNDITDEVTSLITKAEVEYSHVTKAGNLKHEMVVTSLYELVPSFLKGIITREIISALVQNTFDSMAAYAKIQLDKVSDKVVESLNDK